MNIAIIPARGGSKRIPKKNIRDFCGKPIIAHSIELAIESKLFEKIIVTTDDLDIANISKNYGAEVPFIRDKNLSDDFTGTDDVIKDAIQKLGDMGCEIDYACCIYPTAPLIIPEDLQHGFDIISSGDWHTVFAASKFSYPIERSFKITIDGGLEMLFPDNFETRSQDLSEVYHDAGQFYWSHSSSWMNKKPGFNASSTIVPLPGWRVQDIDNLDDWRRAEFIFKLIHNK